MRPLATFLLLVGSLLLNACNLEAEDSGPLLELTLDFGAHPVADYLAEGSSLALTYTAQRPEEKGVKMEEHAACGRYELLRPFTCPKYTSPAVRRRDIRPSDLSWISPSRLRLRVPEGLAGPGAYSLTQIYLNCPPQSCGNNPGMDQWRLDVEPTVDVLNTSSVLPGLDVEHSVIVSATGRGRLVLEMYLIAYPASAQAYADWLNLSNPAGVFALQDAQGQWHLDAQSELLHPNDQSMCNAGEDELSAAERARLGWGSDLKLHVIGELTNHYSAEPRWPQVPAQGCIAVEARGRGDNNYVPIEQRNYALRQGRLVQMSRATDSVRESWRFDEQGRVDLHVRREYREDGTDRLHFWSRTAQAAWPEYVSSAPQVEHAELQRQADEALEIARLRLQTEPQGL